LCVFELPSLRNTRNAIKQKEIEEKLTSIFLSICFGKSFRHGHGLFVKMFYAEKGPKSYCELKQKAKKEKNGWWVVGEWVWDLANARGGAGIRKAAVGHSKGDTYLGPCLQQPPGRPLAGELLSTPIAITS
jgi:hypothetical protein